MFNVISMFGVKIRLHRSLRILLSLLGLLVLCLLFIRHGTPAQKSPPPATDDEEINLVHLFNRAFQLTYQAGQAIRSLKNSQPNLQTFFKKKSFAHLPGEPVTLADLLSHSILSNGLKREFSNLQVVSEEKTSIDQEQLAFFQTKFDVFNEKTDIPFIANEKTLMNVPVSSVAVWIDPLDATKEFTENLLQYVTVMLCITVDKQPTVGIVYAPFTDKLVWAWVDVGHSSIKRERHSLLEAHKPTIDEIIVSRSHAGRVHQILPAVYRDKQYRIIPAAGSGYKTVQLLEEYADYYLHVTPIKKWDVCAPDALLRASHGSLTTLTNRTISYDHRSSDMLITEGLLGTYKRNHQEILRLLSTSNLTHFLSAKSNRNQRP